MGKTIRFSLRSKITLALLCTALVPFFIATLFTYRNVRSVLEEQTRSKLLSAADDKTASINIFVSERKKDLHHITSMPVMRELLKASASLTENPAPRAQEYLKNLANTYSYTDAYLIQPNGVIIAQAFGNRDVGTSLRDSAHKDSNLAKAFESALTLMAISVSDFDYRHTGEIVGFFAMPVFENRKITGVIAISVGFEGLQQILNIPVGLGESGELVIGMERGDGIDYFTSKNAVGTLKLGGPAGMPLQNAMQGKKGFGIGPDYKGALVWAAWRYVPELRWGMTVKMDAAEAIRPAAQLNRIFGSIAFAILLVVIFLSVIMAKKISGRVSTLKEFSQKISRGELFHKVDIPGNDEISDLAESFNQMAQALNETTVSRDELKREVLEKEREQAARKNLEGQLVQSQKMEAIGKLAGGIAHDFNNLLTVINGYAEILSVNVKEKDLQLSVEEIKKAGDRAASITSQLLSFSRKQIVKPVLVDVNERVAVMGSMLCRLIGENIEFLFKPGKPVSVIKIDPSQLEQVVMNLAINARDAMPEGGKLIIETKNVEIEENSRHPDLAPGKYVLVSVTDTGCGMEPEIQRRIFEPFFTTKQKPKGTGLGLSTVYGIIKQSGADISVYSEAGHGTRFNIYFIAESRSGADETPKSETASSGGSETLLLVEDEKAVRGLAAAVLRKAGYQVIEAENGQEALKAAQNYSGRIDLLFTDVIMPLMGGKELYDHLHEEFPHIQALFTSGYTDEAIDHHGILDPDVQFLQKPYSRSELLLKLREVLANKK